jgi:hypothetical protein
VVEADDAAGARQAARAAGVWSPTISAVGADERVEPGEIVRNQPERTGSSSMLFERPILTIAAGVFLGMLAFSLVWMAVGAVIGG